MGDRQSDFVNMMLPYAIAVGKKTGLDPRLVIAQSALETGYGQSAPNNNYFGIKSHGKQGGATMATTEVYNGQPTRVNDSFRTYSDPGQSAADYAQFLLDNPRYRGVLAETTLGGQINAMGASGYATDPQYADKLRAIATGLPISEGAMIGAETMAALGKGPTVSFLPNGDMSTGGGGMAGGNVTMSTMGGQQDQAPSIWNNLFGGALADPDKRARLAIALEGMTLNPNQALIQTQAEGIKSRADEKKAATEINRTAAWLRSQGRDDLAAAVESGALGGRDAAGIAMQPAPTVKPMSAAGKLEADYRAGLITPEAYKAGMAGLASSGTTVNVGQGGQPSPQLLGTSGLVAIPDASSPQGWRIEPAQGSPLAEEAKRTAKSATVAEGAKEIAGSTIISAADRARNAAKSMGATGLIGSALSYIPTTEAAEVYRQVDVLKSQAKVENLTAMRAASPTGGALGSVTEKEAEMLAAKSGALDPKSPNFSRDLDDYELTLLQTIHGPAAGKAIFDQSRNGVMPVNPAGVATIATDAEYDALPSGTEFVGPDGVKRRKP